jgi:hypothetical protein
MLWHDFASAAPSLALPGKARLDQAGIALIGTIRRDGSPRIDPIEPFFAQGHLLLGMLRESRKALDLLRDPRCVVHSAVSRPDGSEGEFKLLGRAVAVHGDDPRNDWGQAVWQGYSQAYAEKWHGPPPAGFPGHLFTLDIASAAWITWDLEQGEMLVKQWSLQHGLSETRRKYP